MNKQYACDLILRPVVTEKSMIAKETANKYSFVVAPQANKFDVKKAITEIFNVQVKSVNIIVRKGKTKIFRQRMGKRSDIKYAIVTLAAGNKIDFE